MMILQRADGTRIAIETTLISVIDESDEGKAPVAVFCGHHRHVVEMTFDAVLAAIEDYETNVDNDDDGDENEVNTGAAILTPGGKIQE